MNPTPPPFTDNPPVVVKQDAPVLPAFDGDLNKGKAVEALALPLPSAPVPVPVPSSPGTFEEALNDNLGMAFEAKLLQWYKDLDKSTTPYIRTKKFMTMCKAIDRLRYDYSEHSPS